MNRMGISSYCTVPVRFFAPAPAFFITHNKPVHNQSSKPQSCGTAGQDELKLSCAKTALNFVKSDMIIGLGTGSTAAQVVTHLAHLLASKCLTNIVGVPTSVKTELHARSLGIPISDLDVHPLLDLTIDGADEVDPDLNLVKGRGGALLREKMVAMASKKFVVAVDETKLVKQLGGSKLAVPVEVVKFCWKYNLRRLKELFAGQNCHSRLRMNDDGSPFVTDNGNYVVDLFFESPMKDVRAASHDISALVGVVEHGLFLEMASSVVVAGRNGVEVKSK